MKRIVAITEDLTHSAGSKGLFACKNGEISICLPKKKDKIKKCSNGVDNGAGSKGLFANNNLSQIKQRKES